MDARFDRALLRAIQETLMEEWDPIGVKGIPEASDEYDSQALRIYSYLNSGWSADVIAVYLQETENIDMGLTEVRCDSCLAVARRLLEIWRKHNAA